MRTFEIDPQAVKTFMLKRILLSSLWTLVICCGIVQAQSSQERPSKKLLRTEIVSVIDERTRIKTLRVRMCYSSWRTINHRSTSGSMIPNRNSKRLILIDLQRRPGHRASVSHGIVSGSRLCSIRYMLMSGRSLWRLPISPRFKELGLDASALHSNTLASVFGGRRLLDHADL